MRSGRTPAGQSRCRRQADRRGQERRRRLCADARDDQHHGGQPRATVRRDRRRRRPTPASPRSANSPARSASIVHIGSLAIKVSPDKAANRAFLIDPRGEIVARYDKIHMFDVDLAERRELSRVAQLPRRRARGGRRPAVGPARHHGLLRSALSGALPRAGRGRRVVPGHSVGLHQADRRGALARAHARPRHRERLLRARRRAGRQARERPRDVRPFAGGRPVGPHPGRGRHRAGRGHGRDRSGRGRGGARASAVAAARPALRDWSSRWRSRRTCARCGDRHDPLLAHLRPQARIRNLVQELRRLRQAGEARTGVLPGLRLGEGREGADGALARRRQQESGLRRRARSRRPPLPEACAARAPRRRSR